MKRWWIVLVWVVSIVIGSVVLAQDVRFNDVKDKPYDARNGTQQSEQAVDLWGVLNEDAVSPSSSVAERIQQLLGVDYGSQQRATFFIKNVFNRFLAIIGVVALIVLIYGFYQMFANKDNEDGFKTAKKIVIWAVIALFVMGTSWFIVSLLFEIFEKTRDAV